MAMLRNLRNMITKGISEAHHKKILSRLTNKVRSNRAKCVLNSFSDKKLQYSYKKLLMTCCQRRSHWGLSVACYVSFVIEILLSSFCKLVFSMCLQKAVIQSRQFPFRFLAAYKVIMELHTLGEIHKH